MKGLPILRRATLADLDAMLALEAGLPMSRHAADTQAGGFLLDADPERLRAYLGVGCVWLLELGGELAAFSLALDDASLRASPLWAQRERIEWAPAFEARLRELEGDDPPRVAYVHQLAALPSRRARYWGAALGLRSLFELFDERGHELVLTTTVREPVLNRAALSYLARVGAQEVGQLDEHYPGLGRLRSSVHAIEVADFHAAIRSGLASAGPATRAIHALSLPTAEGSTRS